MGKLLGEIMSSLDIDKHKIELPEQQAQAEPQTPQGQGQGPIAPTQDMASVPDAGATGSAMMELFGQEDGGVGFNGPRG